MPTYVPDRPATTRTSDHIVGRAVSQRHGRAWQDSLSFLLGYCLPPVVDSTLYAATGSPREIFIAYKRSPGARGLAVIAELHDTTNAGQSCQVLVELEGGGTAYLGPTGPFRPGSSPIMAQAGTWTDRAQHLDVLDVSALTVGTVYWIKVTWTNTPGTTRGLCRIKAFEVPRAALAEDATDAGIDGGWPFAGNGLYDGSSSSLSGFKRFAGEILRARDEIRRHMQCVTLASNGTSLNPQSWILPSHPTTFTAALFNRTVQPGFWFRVRRKFETTTPHRHGFLCRYRTVGTTAEIRVTATSRTTGTVATVTVALPASATYVASTLAYIDIPCDGTDQDVRVTMEYRTANGTDLHLSQFVLFEDDGAVVPAAALAAEDGSDLQVEDGTTLAPE